MKAMADTWLCLLREGKARAMQHATVIAGETPRSAIVYSWFSQEVMQEESCSVDIWSNLPAKILELLECFVQEQYPNPLRIRGYSTAEQAVTAAIKACRRLAQEK